MQVARPHSDSGGRAPVHDCRQELCAAGQGGDLA